jgi:hypothetical protein
MTGTRTRPGSATIVALGVIVSATLMAPSAHAQELRIYSGSDAGFGRSVGRSAIAIGGALALNLFAARLWFELDAGEAPPPPPLGFPPVAPCCYAPPPPPVMMMAPVAPPPAADDPVRLGLAVSGLIQSSGAASDQSPRGGVAASLQFRTSARSLFGLEVQSLTSDRTATHSRRDELAGLMAGRLFPWDAPFAPYLELAGGLGRVAIDTQALEVDVAQIIGRAGLGIELRLGPHLVLDAQVAQVHRFSLGHQANTVAASDPASTDPAFVGQHEQLTELRGGLGYRF